MTRVRTYTSDQQCHLHRRGLCLNPWSCQLSQLHSRHCALQMCGRSCGRLRTCCRSAALPTALSGLLNSCGACARKKRMTPACRPSAHQLQRSQTRSCWQRRTLMPRFVNGLHMALSGKSMLQRELKYRRNINQIELRTGVPACSTCFAGGAGQQGTVLAVLFALPGGRTAQRVSTHAIQDMLHICQFVDLCDSAATLLIG